MAQARALKTPKHHLSQDLYHKVILKCHINSLLPYNLKLSLIININDNSFNSDLFNTMCNNTNKTQAIQQYSKYCSRTGGECFEQHNRFEIRQF